MGNFDGKDKSPLFARSMSQPVSLFEAYMMMAAYLVLVTPLLLTPLFSCLSTSPLCLLGQGTDKVRDPGCEIFQILYPVLNVRSDPGCPPSHLTPPPAGFNCPGHAQARYQRAAAPAHVEGTRGAPVLPQCPGHLRAVRQRRAYLPGGEDGSGAAWWVWVGGVPRLQCVVALVPGKDV